MYLGSLGYCRELALRPSVQHSASESEYNFERALPMVASLVAGSLLVRADSRFCSLKLMQEVTRQADTPGSWSERLTNPRLDSLQNLRSLQRIFAAILTMTY